MATYEPPTEDLAIFDPSVFGKTSFITTGAGDNRYLRFPVAQGAETLQETTINGVLTVNNVSNLDGDTAVRTNHPLVQNASFSVIDTSSSKRIVTIPNIGAGLYNPATDAGSCLLLGTSNLIATEILQLTSWSATNNYVKIRPTSVGMGAGGLTATPTTSVECDGTSVTTTGVNATFTTTNPPTCSATQPAYNDNSTKIPTTSWVQSAITGAIPTSLLGLNNSWTGTNDFLNTGTGSLTSSATQPAPSDNSTKIPTTSWVQSAISAVGSILGLNNTWTGTQNWTNTALGALTSSAAQPSVTDSSTKIPTTAWVQSVLGQFLDPKTTIVTTAQQIFPPTALHLYARGYIIARGGLAGAAATPDFGPWDLGGAGGGAGGVSFDFQLQNNTLYVYFALGYTSTGYSSLSFNNTTPSVGNTFAIANKGGDGADAAIGGGGGSGGTGTFTAVTGTGLLSLTNNGVTNGTAGTAGTGGQTGSTLILPVGGTNALNGSYGFGQRNPELIGYNTSGYINYPASPIGSPVCAITWYVSPPP